MIHLRLHRDQKEALIAEAARRGVNQQFLLRDMVATTTGCPDKLPRSRRKRHARTYRGGRVTR